MPRLFDLQNQRTMIIIAGVAVLLLAILIVLVVRSLKRRAKAKEQAAAENLEMEREWRFSTAAEELRFLKSPIDVAKEVSALFREHVSMPVIAIYAARDGDERLVDVFTHADSPISREGTVLPASFPLALVAEFQQPRLTRLSALVGGGGANAPGATSPREEVGGAGSSKSAEDTVAILPWHGAFGWNGVLVARAVPSTTSEVLARCLGPVAHLGDRLAVALELTRGRAELDYAAARSHRSVAFYRSLIASLEEPSPLTKIASEVADLVEADSAALWRVDDAGTMLRMVGSEGLRATEFLPLPLGQGLAGTIAQSGEPLALEDAPGDPRCLFPREARESGIASYLGVPVKAGDQVIAVIEAHSAGRRSWNDADLSALKSAAESIAEVVQATDAKGSRLRVENAYLGLAEAMQRLRSRDEVLEAVVEVLGHALGVSRALVVEIDQGGSPQPITHEYKSQWANIDPAAGLDTEILARVASAVANGEMVAISNSRERSLVGSDAAEALQVLSELAIPVKVDGKVRAIIYLHQCDRFRDWKQEEVEFTARVGRQLSLSLANLAGLDESAREAAKAAAHIAELERRLARLERRLPELEKALATAREAEEQAQNLLALARAAEAEARASSEASERAQSEILRERDQLREDEARLRRSSQQLLEINRLKSDFITNAGRELESSLSSLIGFVEQLSQGIYGPLTDEQFDALRNIYSWARRLKSDVEWLIDYGSTRSRRLETGGEAAL